MKLYLLQGVYTTLPVRQGDAVATLVTAQSQILTRDPPITDEEFRELVSGLAQKHRFDYPGVLSDLTSDHGFKKLDAARANMTLTNCSLEDYLRQTNP